MSITTLTRFKVNPGGMEEAIANSKRAKAVFERLGAEYARLGTIYSGTWAGQLLLAVRYPDWETYGSVQAAARQDSEYQSLMSEVMNSSAGEIQGRSIIEGIDS